MFRTQKSTFHPQCAFLCFARVSEQATRIPVYSINAFFSHGATVPSGPGPPHDRGDHTQTHDTRYDSSGSVISPTQRLLPDNTQHPQETDIHEPGKIQTRSPSKQAAAEPRLTPRGHWDRQYFNNPLTPNDL
jgi:hypothetical protein